jgi:hypothetical protein
MTPTNENILLYWFYSLFFCIFIDAGILVMLGLNSRSKYFSSKTLNFLVDFILQYIILLVATAGIFSGWIMLTLILIILLAG